MSPSSPARPRAAVFLLPLALGLSAYTGAFGAGFVWDDTHLIVGNTLLRQASPLPAISSDFWQEGERTDFYRPLVSLSYFLEFRLWRLSPAGYHAANIAYHLLTTLAVTWTAWLLVGSPLGAALAGALFAVHPIHTESVAFISGRPDLLAGLLLVLAFGCFVRARTLGRRASPASAALFGGALLSKEAALALPAILVAWELTRGPEAGGRPSAVRGVGGWMRHLGAVVGPYLGVIGLYFGLRLVLLGEVLGRGGDPTGFGARGAIALNAVGEYLGLLLLPYPAAPDRLPDAAIGARSVLALGALALLLGAALARWRWSRIPAFLLAWFVLALLPASPLVPGRPPQVAERFLYIPSAAGAWLLGWLGARAGRAPWCATRARRGLLAGLLVLVAIGAVELTRVRVDDWRDEGSLFRRMAASEPRSYLAPLNLGYLALRRGRLSEAAAEFLRARELRPRSSAALLGLALVESRRGEHDRAIEDARRARDLAPDGEAVWAQLGAILGLAGRYPEAATSFGEAVRRNPRRLQARGNLVAALADAGQPAAARAALAELASRLAAEAYPDPADLAMVSALRERLAPGTRSTP